MRVHHIGYLVKNLDKARAKFEVLGYSAEGPVTYDDYRGIDIQFLINGETRVELIKQVKEDSIVANLYDRYKNSPYHICYIADHFEEDIEYLRKNGFVEIDEPHEAPALNDKKVTFFMNASIGIIELLEE